MDHRWFEMIVDIARRCTDSDGKDSKRYGAVWLARNRGPMPDGGSAFQTQLHLSRSMGARGILVNFIAPTPSLM
jgi:hypothetical protein